MPSRNPVHAAAIAPPIPFPAALFVVALLTDMAYARTADPLWTTMSSWLLLAGLAAATVALLSEVIRVLGEPGVRGLRPAWMLMLGNGLAVLLSTVNFVFHVRDGYSAVVPAGPVLSAVVVAVLMLTGSVEWALVRRRRGREI
jgi:uncharacterized membrane protein